MKLNWSMLGHLAQVLGPTLIATLNPKLAPLSGAISAGISEAYAMQGASNADKLQHVLNITDDAAAGINQTAGKVLVNPVGLHEAATEAINTTVAIIKLAHPVVVQNTVAIK